MSINLNRVGLRISAGQPNQFPAAPVPQVAFSGRSNVGKSSLVNCLLGRKSLARISSAPGKTVTVNFYDIDGKLFFVDLPGYGFAKRRPEEREQWSALTDGYFTKNKHADLLRLVIQLIDSRVGPTGDDEMMLSYLRTTGTPFLVAATKADKLNATEREASEIRLRTHPLIPADTVILFTSSEKGEGRTELWRLIADYTGVRL